MAASPADDPAPWMPVITRPDPMTAEEREACLERDLAEDLDPGELQWEDEFLDPDADLTEAELAEIAAAAGRGVGQRGGGFRDRAAAGRDGGVPGPGRAGGPGRRGGRLLCGGFG